MDSHLVLCIGAFVLAAAIIIIALCRGLRRLNWGGEVDTREGEE